MKPLKISAFYLDKQISVVPKKKCGMSRLLIEIVTRASARDFTVNHETLNKHSNQSNMLQLILQEILNKHLTNNPPIL